MKGGILEMKRTQQRTGGKAGDCGGLKTYQRKPFKEDATEISHIVPASFPKPFTYNNEYHPDNNFYEILLLSPSFYR